MRYFSLANEKTETRPGEELVHGHLLIKWLSTELWFSTCLLLFDPQVGNCCVDQSTSHASPPSTSPYLSTEEGVRNMWSFWPLENYSAVKMNNAGLAQAITWRNLGNNGLVKGIREKRLHIV